MKKGLVEKSLDQICTISHGFAFKGANFKKDNDKSKPIVITPGNFTEDATLNFSQKNTQRYSGIEPDGVRFKIGELVVVMTDLSSKMKILGKPAFVEQDNVLHNQRIGRVIFNDDDVDSRYLYYFFRTTKFQDEIKLTATGTMVKHTAPKRILSNSILVPPLSEQEEIVEVLDKAFAAIDQAKANIEQNIANAKELFQSKLNQIFSQKGEGWVEKIVGDIADHRLGKMLDKRKNQGTLRPYLRNKSVRWFDFDLDDIAEMKFEDDEVDRYTATKGDVLICEGGYPGRAAIWEFDEPIFFQKAVHRVRFHEPILNKWLLYLLYHRDSTGDLKNHFTGAGIQHFTGKALARFPIPVGPVSSMKRSIKEIDALLELTNQVESHYQTKLASLDELKKSILQKAFAGELT